MLAALSPYLGAAKAALVAAVLLGLFALGVRVGAGRVQAEWDAEKAQRLADALQASQEARRLESRRATNVQEAQDHARKIASAARADAVGARDELERLRGALADRDRAAQAPGAECRVDAGAVERQLLGACAATLEGLAREADQDRGRLIELQGYVRAITQE